MAGTIEILTLAFMTESGGPEPPRGFPGAAPCTDARSEISGNSLAGRANGRGPLRIQRNQ